MVRRVNFCRFHFPDHVHRAVRKYASRAFIIIVVAKKATTDAVRPQKLAGVEKKKEKKTLESPIISSFFA